MKRLKGESDDQLANRLYSWQMEIYSSYAMTDLWIPFWQLPKKVQQQWIEKASKYPDRLNRIPSESVDAEARDRAKAVEARVGSAPGGRRPVVVGDTSVQEPSPIDYSKFPACAARRAAAAARLAKHRAKKAVK
jgi:hypothetical protein